MIFSQKLTLNCIHTALGGCGRKQLDFNCEKMSNLVSEIWIVLSVLMLFWVTTLETRDWLLMNTPWNYLIAIMSFLLPSPNEWPIIESSQLILFIGNDFHIQHKKMFSLNCRNRCRNKLNSYRSMLNAYEWLQTDYQQFI